MSVPDSEQPLVPTEHALLVPLGRFARQIGLIDALHRIPVKMKTIAHRPGDKLAELLAHILAGGMHVNELAASPHPLVQDPAVAEAWGQEAFASASGVNALLRAVSPQDVAALRAELQEVLAPYRRRILRELCPSFVVVDGDLTGLVVSDQATTYEGADFGYMGEVGAVGKGYQFARMQLQGRREALVLGGFLHPGRTVPLHCLRELIALVEATVGRPRRRVEAVEGRLTRVEHQLAALEQRLARPGEHPRLQRRRERLRQEGEQLRQRRDELAADNAATPSPRRIILRLDGGFGDTSLLAWLYEQGYDFVVRGLNHRIALCLRKEQGLVWEKISKNGRIAPSSQRLVGRCPYPLRLFVCRQYRGEAQPERWSSLLATPELTEQDWPARRVGVFYNGRQIMEAGIKEGKGVLASRHLPTRHEAGIALYQELVLLAQNLLRWFRRQVLRVTPLATSGIKELVRVAARSRALVQIRGRALVLQFTAGPWRGITLSLPTQLSYQLWFSSLENWSPPQAGP